MESRQEIDKAIGAHGMWKTRLSQAVDKGKIDTPPGIIRQNNQCDFGKWLQGPTITPQDKASQHYKTVNSLHTQFHQVAAQVAEAALSGKKTEAQNLLGTNGEFTKISSKLTAAMMEWKKAQNLVPTH